MISQVLQVWYHLDGVVKLTERCQKDDRLGFFVR
jgi:hypothetical protein